MTWLTGTTTWGELENELAQLICGEKAANGNSATVAAADRWLREESRTITGTVSFSGTTMTDSAGSFTSADVGLVVLNSNVPGGGIISAVTSSTTATLSVTAATASSQTVKLVTNTLRTPASKDVVTGSCSTRTGYFTNTSWSDATAIRVTSPYTSTPATGTSGRWGVWVNISSANTVSGNYSTISATYRLFDLDTSASTATTSISVNAAGVASLSNGLQITITNPATGIATAGSYYRGFTSAYTYGIDPWPMLYRTAGSVSFTTSPPGVAGTDYDIVTQTYGTTNGSFEPGRSMLLHGLGIKTATGLGGNALYTYSFPMAFIKARIFKSATAGVLSIDVGGSRRDTLAPTTMQCIEGFRVTTWLKAFQTAASVSTSSAVQYFLSVKADGVAITLNGDTSATGKLTTAWLGSFTPTEPTYDKFPFAFSVTALDFTADQSTIPIPGCQFSYFSQKYRQDGSNGTRDWQTGWGSCGHWITSTSYWRNSDFADQTSTTALGTAGSPSRGSTSGAIVGLVPLGIHYGTTNGYAGVPIRQTKPGHDSKWWLYRYTFGQGAYTADGNGNTASEDRLVRGTVADRFYFIPEEGWSSGDELIDTSTGNKYLLLKPDYCGLGHRIRVSTSTFAGGVAIAEV